MFLFTDLTDGQKEFIYIHLIGSYPKEGCGLVFQDIERGEFFVLPVLNTLEASEGVSDTQGFIMDAKYIWNILMHYLTDLRYKFVAMYHSHTTDVPLIMSEVDKFFAKDASGFAVHEHLSHVIFKVVDRKIQQIHTYRWQWQLRDFDLKQELNFFKAKSVL